MQNKQQRIFQPTLFREYLKSKLISLLDSIAGKKLLMLEQLPFAPINLVTQKAMFTDHGVPAENGIILFENTLIDKNFDQVVILISPTANHLRTLKQLVVSNLERGNKKFYVVFWPKRTVAAKQFLQNQDFIKCIQIRDFSFDLLPLDIDLYSLQIKSLKDLYIYHDHSIYNTVAESIHRLQCVFGKILNIFYKGKGAKAVYDIIKLKENEIKIQDNYGDIQSLIILDRSVDFLTPLLKQLTYEALVDEFFGINGNIVKIPSALFQQAKQKKTETGYKNIQLNSQKDYFYQQVRILSLNGARAVLKVKAAQFDQFTQNALLIKDINQKHAATKKISAEREYLKKHLTLNSVLSEEMRCISFHKELLLQQKCLMDGEKDIVQYFQNMIPFDIPLEKILRSICLQSIIDNGISKKIYPRLCEDISLTYGVGQIVSLTNLAKLGLFYEQGYLKQPYPFSTLKKELKLISQATINHQNPNDPCFAYGGYTPIMTRLVEGALRGGWRQMGKALKLLPGQFGMPQVVRECLTHPKPAVVVYFIGGVTYSEVATIRLLSKFLKKQIIVATTEMINGENMIKSLIQKTEGAA